MKLLGYLFVLALVLAAIGYFRGWFAITTVQAGGKSTVELTLDKKKLGDDRQAVTKQLTSPASAAKSEHAAAVVDGNEVEGVLTVVDVAARNLTLTVGSRTIVQHVATAVAVTNDGASIGLDELRADMRAKLVFDQANEPRELLRIEILR